MRKTVVAGFAAMLGACANAPAQADRQAEAYALAQQRAERLIDLSFKSLSSTNVFDADCSIEVGVDAKQCNAFLARMATELKKLEAIERPKALADLRDEIEDLAAVVATLSEADIAKLRRNVALPLHSDLVEPISEEAQLKIQGPDRALNTALLKFDQLIGDQFNELGVRILFLLLADPALQKP